MQINFSPFEIDFWTLKRDAGLIRREQLGKVSVSDCFTDGCTIERMQYLIWRMVYTADKKDKNVGRLSAAKAFTLTPSGHWKTSS